MDRGSSEGGFLLGVLLCVDANAYMENETRQWDENVYGHQNEFAANIYTVGIEDNKIIFQKSITTYVHQFGTLISRLLPTNSLDAFRPLFMANIAILRFRI